MFLRPNGSFHPRRIDGPIRTVFEHAIRVSFGALTRIAFKAGEPLRDEEAAMIIQQSAEISCGHGSAGSDIVNSIGCRVWCLFRLTGQLDQSPWLKGYILISNEGGFDLTEHIIEAAAVSEIEADNTGHPRFVLKQLRQVLKQLGGD